MHTGNIERAKALPVVITAAWIVVAGWLSTAAAQVDDGLAAEVERLLLVLDDPDSTTAEQNQAEKRLIELGPNVLDHLRSVDSAVAEQRLQRVRAALEKEAVSLVSEPSLVTLVGEYSIDNALKEISEQTGNRLQWNGASDETIEFDLRETTFWDALDEVLDRGGLTVNPYGGSGSELSLMRANSEPARVTRGGRSGLFRTEIVRVESVRDRRNPQATGVRLSMEVAWEPRLRPISLSQTFDEIEVTDNAGNEIPLNGFGGQTPAIQPSLPFVDMSIPLQLPDRSMRSIASVKGAFTAMVPGRIETFEFPEIGTTRNKELRRGGVTVTFQRLVKNLDVYQAQILVRFDETSGALESHRTWIFRNDAFLLDEDGNRVEGLGFQTTRQTETELGIAYIFDLTQDPDSYRFMYKTPAAIVPMRVEYELRDIELP